MFSKMYFTNPDPGIPHCHAPSICQAASGSLLMVWYAYPNIETEEGILVLVRKPAGSSEWSATRRILTKLNGTLANPVLFEDADGVLWLMFVTLRGHYWDSAVLMASRSSDEGETWSTPHTVINDPGMMVRHPALMRGDRSVILPAYDERSNETVLLSYNPHTSTWTEYFRFAASKAIQACLVGVSIRKWIMVLRPTGEQRACLRTISNDEGQTWSQVIQTSLPNPLSGIAAFQSGEELCVVHNHTTEHQRYPLSMCCSRVQGVS
ncbi:MAG: exo-alpha-sialidase, partial [Planctomycetes bacterium]|nr:exo-alpha-sialidase [Planctomycetota bacterium]